MQKCLRAPSLTLTLRARRIMRYQVVLRVQHSLHATWARNAPSPKTGQRVAMGATDDEAGGGGELSQVLLEIEEDYGQRGSSVRESEVVSCGLDLVLELLRGVGSAREVREKGGQDAKTIRSNASRAGDARDGVLEMEGVHDIVERCAAQVCMRDHDLRRVADAMFLSISRSRSSRNVHVHVFPHTRACARTITHAGVARGTGRIGASRCVCALCSSDCARMRHPSPLHMRNQTLVRHWHSARRSSLHSLRRLPQPSSARCARTSGTHHGPLMRVVNAKACAFTAHRRPECFARLSHISLQLDAGMQAHQRSHSRAHAHLHNPTCPHSSA